MGLGGRWWWRGVRECRGDVDEGCNGNFGVTIQTI